MALSTAQATLEAAYTAWMRGGSIGLGRWLSDYREHAGRSRMFETREYGRWVEAVKELEMERTVGNAEYCIGGE